jgi:parvulin-like peptidyl-prolyl isomerase/post-segregation antitoxin (ccd killing protein)
MRSRSLVGFAAVLAVSAACGGLKDALTAHVDVVAKAGSQELSVNRLGDLLGNAKLQVPVTRPNAQIIADIWTGYQQLAFAAAHSDSLNDKKAIDQAVAPMVNAQKLQHFMDSVSKTFKADSGNEAAYNQAAGNLVAARHILIGYKNAGVPPSTAEKDSVRKKAEQVRAQVTDANFTDMVKKYSTDPGAAQNNGNYGVFKKEAMVPQFSNAIVTLKPGEISQPVESQYGFHIIQRLPYAQVKNEFAQQYSQASQGVAMQTYLAQAETTAKIQIKDNAVATMKTVAREPNKHHNDRAALATFNGGELTVSDFLGWVETAPPQQQILQRIPDAPDSVLKPFVKSLATQQVLLKRANDAKVDLSQKEKDGMYAELNQLVTQVWQTLNVDPKSLADSAKSTAEKERLAAARVDNYLDRMLGGQAQLLTVPTPLKKILDAKYEATINEAGLDRAFERAQHVRASSDSAKAANTPKSQVPIPGMGAPGGAAPPGAAGPPPAGADTKSPPPAKKP